MTQQISAPKNQHSFVSNVLKMLFFISAVPVLCYLLSMPFAGCTRLRRFMQTQAKLDRDKVGQFSSTLSICECMTHFRRRHHIPSSICIWVAQHYACLSYVWQLIHNTR